MKDQEICIRSPMAVERPRESPPQVMLVNRAFRRQTIQQTRIDGAIP